MENKIRHRKFFFEKYIEVTPDIEEMIIDHVLTKSEGGKYKENRKTAVIWWSVREKEEGVK